MTDEIELINDGMQILNHWERSQFLMRMLVAANWESADELVREINNQLLILGCESRAPSINLEVADGRHTLYFFPRLTVMNEEEWLQYRIWYLNRYRGKCRPPITVRTADGETFGQMPRTFL